jgi:hypothetical protein
MNTYRIFIPTECVAIYEAEGNSPAEAKQKVAKGFAHFVRNEAFDESGEQDDWTIIAINQGDTNVSIPR